MAQSTLPLPNLAATACRLHIASPRSRGCQSKQLLQLSTARLLPGRSAPNRLRNGRKLTLHCTGLAGAAPMPATERQHQQRVHRPRVERVYWCT